MREKNHGDNKENSLAGCCGASENLNIENKSDNLDEIISRQRLLSRQVFSPPPLLIGVAAAIAVVGFYLGLITLVSDWYNARMQFEEYRWWILALAAGLGVQATLYSFLRIRLNGKNVKSAKSSLAASGGMSIRRRLPDG